MRRLFSTTNLRSQLILIALFAILPMLGLIIYSGLQDRQAALNQVDESIQHSNQLGASIEGQKVEGARQLLHTLAQIGEVRTQNGPACNQLFSTLIREYPTYQNLVATRLNGNIFCSAKPMLGPINIADRPYFQNALTTKDFTVGEYQISRITGQPVIVFALPVLDDQGKPSAVVSAALNLDALNIPGIVDQLPSGSTLLVLDRNGTVLWRIPDSQKWIGKNLSNENLVRTVVSKGSGHADLSGLDGIQRRYAFAPVDGSQGKMFVSVGVPLAGALGPADEVFYRNLAWLLIASVLALLAAWFIGNQILLKPIHVLSGATQKLEHGDLSTRIQEDFETRELNQLAHSFNSMVGSLEESTEQIRLTEANFRNLVEQTPAITYRSMPNEKNSRIYISPQAEEILGYPASDWLINPNFWLEHIVPEDRKRVEEEWCKWLETGGDWDNQYGMLSQSGRVIPFSDQARQVNEASEAILQGVMFDISEGRQRERELEALARVASALRNIVTTSEMMPVILNQVLSLLQAQGALFVREDPVAKDMVLEYAVGAWTPARGKRIPGNRGISAQVLKTGQPYLTNHASEDPVLIRSYFLGDLEYAACVPLSTQRQTVGAIWIGKSSELGSNDMRIMMAIANMAASAFHRAQLFDQTQLRLHRLMSLHSIDMAITSSLDIRVTLSMLLDQVTTQLHADAADVLLYRPETKTLEFAAGRGFIGSQIKETILEYGEGYAGRAAKERNVIHVPDLTQDLDQETARILRASEEGFRAYFAAPLIAKGQVNGVLEIFNRSPMYPDPEWKDFLETLATQAAIAVDNAELFEDLQLTNEELSLAYDATIEGWSHALELRDHETQGHSRRVTDLSLHLAHAMHLPDDQMNDFRRGVLLHDIGKMGIPDSILLKPGHLTDNEWRIMRRHPEYAFDMLAPIPYLRKSLEVPYSHHERWNGSGYPRGLKGEQIPFEARIFAVVDVYDALVSDRPYRRAWPEEKVRDYLKEKSGVEFDPHVVDTFLRLNIDGHNGKNHQKKDH